MQPVQPPAGTQTVYLPSVQPVLPLQPVLPTMQTAYPGFPHKQAIVLGSLQVIVGCVSVLANIGGIIVNASVAVISHGIWCGLLFIVTGVLGISAGKYRSACPIIGFMILAIVSAVFCTVMVSLSSIGLVIDDDHLYYHFYRGARHEFRIATNGLMLGLALLEGILAIWSSVLCCAGMCCCRRQQQVQQQGTVIQMGNQPQIVLSGGQQMVVGGQIIASQGQQGQQVIYGSQQDMMPSGHQVMPSGQHAMPGSQQVGYGGQQFMSGGQQVMSGGQQAMSGGQHVMPGGQQVMTGQPNNQPSSSVSSAVDQGMPPVGNPQYYTKQAGGGQVNQHTGGMLGDVGGDAPPPYNPCAGPPIRSPEGSYVPGAQ